jgi:hypothetical protein
MTWRLVGIGIHLGWVYLGRVSMGGVGRFGRNAATDVDGDEVTDPLGHGLSHEAIDKCRRYPLYLGRQWESTK